MGRSIVVVLGHPQSHSFCGALVDAYVEAAVVAGHSVHVFRLGDLAFDPILRQGYRLSQPLEQDLAAVAAAIKAAEHWVLVYPVWWGGMPALLKGFIDRVFLPGYAFKYRLNSVFWDKLLQSRSARVIQTLDTPIWYERLINGNPAARQIKKTILQFCGFNPVKFTRFAPIRGSSAAQRQRWLEQVRKLGQDGH